MAARIVRALALLLVGIYAGGVAFAVLAPSLFTLPGTAYVRYWQALNIDYGAVMPVLLLSGVAVLLATVVLSRRRGRPVVALTVLATVLVVATIALTLTQLEPLNAIANAWNPDRLPADWSTIRDDWRAWHLVRTVLAVAAFGCLLASGVLDDSARTQPTATPTATSVAA